MVGLSAVQQAVLRKYTRAVVHMRRQFGEHRFGLIFGAGIAVIGYVLFSSRGKSNRHRRHGR